ncbi:RNA-binding protein, putative [Entamoeba dispar SAW760]|uniref:RNA-binding protein, putative n=1 Tax=Entamoeba dispar (strain ATCC PRA-260 / SAW760) TaxID=370354 RepID=B0E6V0_ENTDS|nr:RNA-binding protein, putative [Entamoeba dispar SAW760]EDR29691.1 RNA-binding protein, putative [Entamoeba dispar SAW760]|eukprot:EDR29691.1 RNA-binding protein, putative [Entamoeba dispar SAW760]
MRITIQTTNHGLIAYIQFATDHGVTRVLEQGPIIINNQQIRTEKAKTQMTLFFAKMGSSMTQKQFKQECEKFGQVEEATIIFDRETKKSKGCGFVKFVYRDDAVSCYNYHKYKKIYIVEWARSPIHRASQADRYTIFIGNLSKKQANQKIIESKFKKYGKIERITVINRPNETTAYAFVKYDNTLSPSEAIQKENNNVWDGQIIVVELSENTIPNKKDFSHHFQSLNSITIKPIITESSKDRNNIIPILTSFKQKRDTSKRDYTSSHILYSPSDSSSSSQSSDQISPSIQSSLTNSPYSFSPLFISPHHTSPQSNSPHTLSPHTRYKKQQFPIQQFNLQQMSPIQQSPKSVRKIQQIQSPHLPHNLNQIQPNRSVPNLVYQDISHTNIPQQLHRQKYHLVDSIKTRSLDITSSNDSEYEFDTTSDPKKINSNESITEFKKELSPKDEESKTLDNLNSLPDIAFSSSLSHDSLLADAMETPMQKLRREDDFDMESFIRKSSFFTDED